VPADLRMERCVEVAWSCLALASGVHLMGVDNSALNLRSNVARAGKQARCAPMSPEHLVLIC